MKCAVVNCNNSNESKASDCSFFRFPKCAALRKKWISFCGRKKLNTKTSFICMLHFTAEDFANSVKFEMGFAKRRFLKEGSVPSFNIASVGNYELFQERAARIEKRENRKTVSLLLKQTNCSSAPPQENDEIESNYSLETSMTNFDEIKIEPEEPNFLTSDDVKIERLENESIENLPATRSEENVFSDLKALQKLKLKVEKLENENLNLRKSIKQSESALKVANEKLEKMENVWTYDKKQLGIQLAKIKFELSSLEDKLEVIFTKGQIKKLKRGIKRQIWSEDDVAHSITLYSASPKLYRLLHRKQFPLPAVRTLQKWAQKLRIKKGLEKPLEASHHTNFLNSKTLSE